MNQLVLCLYKKLRRWKIPIPGYRWVERDLIRLHPDKDKEKLCEEYYVKKFSMSFLICLTGIIFSVVLAFQANQSKVLKADGTIIRGSFEEEDKEIEIATILENGEEQSFRITVGVKTLTEEELQELYEKFIQQLPELIRGENESLKAVRNDLMLTDSYEGFPFMVDWRSESSDIVTSSGEVEAVEETVEMTLEAVISYGEAEWRKELEILVEPPILTETDLRHKEIGKLIYTAEEATRMDEAWRLPQSYEGQELVWEQTVPYGSHYLLIGSFGVAILLFIMSDKDLHDSLEEKRLKMKRVYPDVVQKLVLYLGAGLTIRGAFQRIAAEYEKERQKGGKEVPLYEEILFTCREMQTGISEGKAYENFGKRTGVQEYIRLSTLLVQNLKKGNNMLTMRLREEAAKACEERLLNGKKLGEEAGTKLLLPMIMMLVVVMLLIMIPAFSSTGV